MTNLANVVTFFTKAKDSYNSQAIVQNYTGYLIAKLAEQLLIQLMHDKEEGCSSFPFYYLPTKDTTSSVRQETIKIVDLGAGINANTSLQLLQLLTSLVSIPIAPTSNTPNPLSQPVECSSGLQQAILQNFVQKLANNYWSHEPEGNVREKLIPPTHRAYHDPDPNSLIQSVAVGEQEVFTCCHDCEQDFSSEDLSTNHVMKAWLTKATTNVAKHTTEQEQNLQTAYKKNTHKKFSLECVDLVNVNIESLEQLVNVVCKQDNSFDISFVATQENVQQWVTIDQQADLIVSNAMLQWLGDPGQFLRDLATNTLSKNGVALLSSYTSGHYQEVSDLGIQALKYYSLQEWLEFATQAGLKVHLAWQQEIVLNFNDYRHLFKHLQLLGVNSFGDQNQQSFSLLRKIQAITNQPVTLTYKPFILVLQKI